MSFISELAQHGDQSALIEDNHHVLTYTQVAEAIEKISNVLKSQQKKSLVFLLANNNIPSIIGYLSVIHSNHVVMLIESTISTHFLGQLLTQYRPEFIYQPIQDKSTYELMHRYMDYGLYRTEFNNEITIQPALSLLLSTSGSTGSPKQVRLTLANLQANAESIINYLALDNTEKAITTLPMNYSYGLSIINTHLLVGASLLLTNYSVMTKEFWDFFNQYQATSLAGVPYSYEMFRKINPFKQQVNSLRYMTQAGGKLNTNLVNYFAQECKKHQVKFYVMYGQTEATARMSYLSINDITSHANSIGKAIPAGQFELVDDTGSVIHLPHVQGELRYKGPNVMLGYAQSRHDLSLGDDLKGVLNTGDLAYFDENGFFYITGRLKRFIKLTGKRINLDEVEKYFNDIAMPVYCGGEDECLKIALLEKGSADSIKKILFDIYQIHHSLIKLYQIDDVPKSSSEKILYTRLFELAMPL